MAVGREALYAEVWAEPMTTVAARYDVSSSFLARVCVQMNIPRPTRGYWAQLKAGKMSARPELPAARPGDPLEWSRDGTPARRALPPVPKAPEALSPDVIQPSRIRRTGLHPLLVGAADQFQHARSVRSKFDEESYLRPYKRALIDVVVSREQLSRALHLANTLFQALESRGHRVVLENCDYARGYARKDLDVREKKTHRYFHVKTWSPSAVTIAYVGTVAFGLTLYEVNHEVQGRFLDGNWTPLSRRTKDSGRSPAMDPWRSTRDFPSGRLALRAYSPYPRVAWERSWVEERVGALKHELDGVSPALEKAAAEIAQRVAAAQREAEEERKRWEEQHRRWEREQAEKRRAEAIKQSRDQLLSIVEAWALAVRVEAFFSDAAARAEQASGGTRDQTLSRLHAARGLLGGVDSLSHFAAWRSPAECFGNDDN